MSLLADRLFSRWAYKAAVPVAVIGGTIWVYGHNRPTSTDSTPPGPILVNAITALQSDIDPQIVAITSDDETDRSPVTKKLQTIADNLCGSDTIQEDLPGDLCVAAAPGDGLAEARQKLRQDVAAIAKESNAEKSAPVLEDIRAALTTVYYDLPRPKPAQTAGLANPH